MAVTVDAAAADVLGFWFDETPAKARFAIDPALDAAIARRFGALHAALAAGVADAWRALPRRLLAAVVVLDQFSRNLHRGAAAAFAQDGAALALSRFAVARHDDAGMTVAERQFLYMPLMHSEDAVDQAQSVALYAGLGDADAHAFAEMHRDCIAQFGRFPGRNQALGRVSTAAERAWLASGAARF